MVFIVPHFKMSLWGKTFMGLILLLKLKSSTQKLAIENVNCLSCANDLPWALYVHNACLLIFITEGRAKVIFHGHRQFSQMLSIEFRLYANQNILMVCVRSIITSMC